MIWQDHLRQTLLEMKFKESVSHIGVFQHETRDILFCVHVDDLLWTGVRGIGNKHRAAVARVVYLAPRSTGFGCGGSCARQNHGNSERVTTNVSNMLQDTCMVNLTICNGTQFRKKRTQLF